MAVSPEEKSAGITRIECATKGCKRMISVFSEHTKCAECRELLEKKDRVYVPTARLLLPKFKI